MTHAPVALAACPSCGHALGGAYCAGCGQKVAPINPSFRDVAHEFIGEVLNIDGKTFSSVRLLLPKPGFLRREYFEGRRARYVSPIRLYLILSLIYFAAAAVAPKRAGEGIQARATRYDDAELRKRGFESEQDLQRAANTAVDTWAPRAMFVLVPLFALLVKGVTRGSGRNYPQHLYFALHTHAAAFALLTVGMLGRYARPPVTGMIGAIVVGLLVWYLVLAFRRAYGGTAARAVLRAPPLCLRST